MKCYTWICEVTSLATKTVLVEAPSRRVALQKLRNDLGEGIDVHYDERCRRVIGRDDNFKKQSNPNTKE